MLTLAVTLPPAQYATAAAQHEYYAQLLERVRSVAGVLASGGIEYLQVDDARPPRGIRDGSLSGMGIWRVTPGYFEAIGTPILHGRDFSEADVREEAPVALVTESVARLLSTGPAPLGQHLRLDDEAEVMIVGVVKDVRFGYGRPTEPSVYRPVTGQELARTIVVRAAGDPAVVAFAVRAEAQRLEPGAILPQPGLAIAAMLDRGIAKATFETMLFVVFGLLALLVTAIGVYGLVGFWVSGRTHEMGIRVALGATAAHLKSWVIRQALFPVMAGLATGAAGAFLLTRRLDNHLYGITPHDGPTFAAVVGVLVGVGLLAAYIPARRAARVDPVIALKAE